MAQTPYQKQLTPLQLIEFFKPALTKDILNSWSSKVFQKAKGKPGRDPRARTFNPAEVREIASLLGTGLTLSANEVVVRHREAQRIASEQSEAWTKAVANLAGAALSGTTPRDRGGAVSEALRQLMLRIAAMMPAQHCALFLLAESTPPELEIVADSRVAPDATHVGTRLPSDSGWTWKAFQQGKIISLFATELETFDGPPQTGHLRGGRQSLLAVPILNSKQKTVGILKIENKLSPHSDVPEPFGPDDEIKAVLTASHIALLLEATAFHAVMLEGMRRLRDLTSFRSLAELTISSAVSLTGATVGEISLREDVEKEPFDLIVEAVAGEGNKLEAGYRVPEPSVASSVLKTGAPRFISEIRDKEQAREYRDCNGSPAGREIRSEVAYPFLASGRVRGILNIESTRPGSDGGVNEQSRYVLEQLSLLTGLADRIASPHDALQHLLTDTVNGHGVLGTMLRRAIEASAFFRHGIGYVAEYRRGVLRATVLENCQLHGGDATVIDGENSEYVVSYQNLRDGERYACAKVMREGKFYFSRYPERDANVHQGGLATFDIHGSLLALPIGFLRAPVPIVLGVLVLWSGGEPLGVDAASLDQIRDEVRSLEALTKLAITTRVVTG